MSSMIDLAMTTDYDVYTEIGGSGRDIVMACGHEVVSNLVRQRLMTEIPSSYYSSPLFDADILRQKMRYFIGSTYGVVATDMSGFKFIETGNRSVDYGNVCFTVDCDNKRQCMTL